MAVRVADTPEVSPLPATEPGPGYTTPRIFAVDYTGEPLKVTQTLSEAGRLREEARRADVKLKVQDAVTHYQFDLRQYMTAEKGPLQKQGSQVLGKDLDGRDYRVQLGEDVRSLHGNISEFYGLTDEERQEFERRVQPTDKEAFALAETHYTNEKRRYAVDVQKNRASAAAFNIAEGGSVTANMAAIRAAAIEHGHITGMDVDTPSGRRVIDSVVKQAVEQGVSAFTDRLIADNRPEDAQLYLYKASTTGGTSGEFLRAQRDKVETALQVKQAKLRADSAVAELKAASTPTGRLVTTLMANGGIADSWGREYAKHMGVKNWDELDQRRKDSYVRDAVDDQLRQYGGDPDLAIAASIVGARNDMTPAETKKWMDQNIELAVDSGGTARDVINYLTPDEKARFTRAKNRYATESTYDFDPTVEQVYAAMKRQNPHGQPEELMAAAKLGFEKLKLERAQQKIVWGATVQQAFGIVQNGGTVQDVMTMQGYSDLPPSFKNHLAAAAERITSGDIDKVGDPVLFQALNSDPTKLASLSDGEFMLLASQLDSQELQILENQRAALKNGVKMDDAVPYSDINQIIDENWGDLGIKEQRESTDGKALKGYLVGYVAPVIRQLKLTKGPLSHAELTKHVLDILGTKVNKPGGIFSDGQTNVANWGSTEGSTREILAKAFGVQDEAALKGRAGVNLFLKLKNAPSVSVTDEYLPLPLRTRIREAYKGAFGKLPDARTTVYLAVCMSEGDKIQVADVLGADGAARLMKAPESLSITDYIPEGPATQRGGRPYVEIYDPLVEGLLGDEKHTIEDR